MAEVGLSKAQELDVIKTAFFLEETIARLKKESQRLHDNKPPRPQKPSEPVLKNQKAKMEKYPPIKVKISLSDARKSYTRSNFEKNKMMAIVSLTLSAIGGICFLLAFSNPYVLGWLATPAFIPVLLAGIISFKYKFFPSFFLCSKSEMIWKRLKWNGFKTPPNTKKNAVG